MRKIIIFALVALAVLSVSVYAGVSMGVTWQTASSTLRPGGETTIALTITNTGTTDLTNVVITPSGGSGIHVTSGKITVSGLPATASQQASISLRADKDATSKISYVYLDADYYTGVTSYEKTFTIPIEIKREPILQITNIRYNETVSPGNALLMTFDIYNSGTGPAKELVISVSQEDVFTIPESSGEFVIDSIGPGSMVSLSFPITIDPDADIGISSIPVEFKYYDETMSNSYTETKNIGMTVAGDIELSVSVEDAIGSTAKISIINRGSASAEYLTVTASAGGVSKEYYVGSLDSDDTETISFPNTRAAGKYDIELKLDYKDKFSNEFSETKVISVNPSIKVNPASLIVLVIIAAVGFWYYRRKRK